MTTRKRKQLVYYSPQWFAETLAACKATIPPPPDAGLPVWECVVPSEWCPPGNARDSMHWSKAHRLKKRLRAAMLRFALTRRSPLPGRPIVHCTRLTPYRTDPRSNWDKFPVDMLRPYTRTARGESGALGLIVDDSGDHIDLRAEWVPSKLRCVYVRVFADPNCPDSGH